MARADCIYFVEGETEENLIKALKKKGYIIPGKVEPINVTQKSLKKRNLQTIARNKIIVFIFDVDRGGRDKLDKNIDMIRRYAAPKEVVCIAQVENLEDELLRACKLKKKDDLFGLFSARNKKEFKKNLKNHRALDVKLDKIKFDFDKMWILRDKGEFKDIEIDIEKIRN